MMSLSSTRLYATLPYQAHGISFVFLGWGPRMRHPVYPAVPLGWEVRIGMDHAASRGTTGDVYARIYGRKGRHIIYGNLTAIYV